MPRLLSWNVAGRVRRQPEQAAVVAAAGADVVCLQEVTPNTAPLWHGALVDAGLVHVTDALDRFLGDRPRALAVLTASREPLHRLPAVPGVTWPDRALETRIGDVVVLNCHSPIAPAPDLAKVRFHEAVAAHLRRAGDDGPRVLCGDLNVPRREHDDGEVMTFAYASNGKLRPERGERWDRAERALVRDLRDAGWVDAYRSLHGYGHREASWTFKDDKGGWRLDHALLRGLVPVSCAYAHDWRRAGLSDHSALVVDWTRQDGGHA